MVEDLVASSGETADCDQLNIPLLTLLQVMQNVKGPLNVKY